MNIERTEFIAWMQRLIDRFDLLEETLAKTQSRKNMLDGEELLDNQDLMLTFKISARSLQRYRSDGKLPYYTISGKIYYKLSDVHQFIRAHFSIPVSALKAKKRNTLPKKDSV
ncbi:MULTISPECIES: helix-turn-helix domain-containing protein [Capnocytophaga]|uniref:helix-turn-helix domain-containing protein n=1 Tax=Capnocytophaga TaxID=1016 RepID=UPI0037D6A6CE